MYFDKYGNKTEKPAFAKPIPAGVSAQTVLDKYLEAIGGKENAKKVSSVVMTGNTNIDGVPMQLSYTLKRMTPNKEAASLVAEGMGELMKSVFDGTSGYEMQQGQRQDLSADKIAEKKGEHVIFPELHYDMKNVSLESLTTIDGEDVYKLKVVEGGKDTYRFYNVASGFLQQVEYTTEQNGQKITTVLGYDNYTAISSYAGNDTVKDIQFPFAQSMKNTAGGRTMNINTLIKSLKFNEGVSEADFK
ncbi:MAG: hypothetical protein HRT68_02650 [Flavobacteriaceae bacterium]|nr:hypothetical protein [Flavobacteriaceae bacterium]